MRVGLFGGSFDPVHRAHLALARCALEHLGLDRLLWVPAGQPWQKTRRLAAPGHRLAMLDLALEGEPRHVVEPCELQRPGPSYTLDTLRELQARPGGAQDEWFLVIGQDQYASLHTWHGWTELLQRATLAVANRAGVAPRPSAEVAARPHRLVELPLPALGASSTEVRRRLAAGEDAGDLVPPAVARYIDQHHLYREAPRS